ncbi:unnamed protein product, partial [Caretta caretta]
RPGPAYWHFNNSLLEDESFVMSFREFWLAWREQWRAFPSVRRWWDLGKVRAKLFCRDYTRGTSRRRDAAIEQLEREVLEMERRLAADPEDPSLCGACREKREELQALEDHRARGAFVRSRIRLLREMDRGSRFFYALEKTRGAKKHVTCLLAEDGTPLTDPEEMCGRARDFYTSLFSPDPTDPDACEVLWEGTPHAKAISLRLGSVMADVVHPDQTYTVPGRSIFDNLFLVRDLLELGRRDGLSFALLSLDQEKAFDRVDHGYLLSTLQAFGFGPQFDPGDLARVEACQAIYSAASSARVNWVKSSGLAVGDWRQAGVATLFSPDLRPEVLGVTEAVPGRLLHLLVHIEGLVVNLVNIYAPTSGPERLQFHERASAFLGTLDSHECLVQGGDFNTTLEEQDRSGTEQSPAATDTLREIVEHHSLVDIRRNHHPDDTSTFTFVWVEAHRSSHSRLDCIYLSRFHLSRAHSSSIRLAPFSDHHLATMTAFLCAERPGPAYWHFNNSLLEDEGFLTSFREFWLAWRWQRLAFPLARQWWDVGKVHARLFCRDYTRGTSRRRNAAIEQLEREVLELERCLAASPEDPLLCRACREKREELRALEDHQARGTFVQSRICLLWEMDHGSRFFYALEKTRGAKKHVTCLLTEDGTPLMEPVEMCGRARAFYASLFPRIRWTLALAECSGRSSLRRAGVLALLPKKGDLRDLRNWHPVSLLSTDYKIVVKAISLQLGSVLADVIHPDQTYTIPDRSIFDNLFLVRDLLELGHRDVLSFALLSLNQEKAFDRVDHRYLLSTLQAFGFGPQFVGFLQVLYASAECLVKLNWTLTEQVNFRRGVRQGCPLLGQLYALAIKPFLGAGGGLPGHLFGSLLRLGQLGQELWLGGRRLAAGELPPTQASD